MNQINKKMSLLEKISYGSGNMGICLCTTLITTFIMYFYTDVVKISVLQVGTIMLIGGIADAVSDAVMGIIVDHTNTRWKMPAVSYFWSDTYGSSLFLCASCSGCKCHSKIYLCFDYICYLYIGIYNCTDSTKCIDLCNYR